ncbi:MAG: glycosyltransferase [Planctomycetes bacterium]|nr:glycosyltransferase [Planctomycetota bacterium]
MQCTVVIPCHRGAELTRECVQSLLAQDGAPILEILLVDNAGDDETAALADASPLVRVLRQPHNLGFAGGVNAGLREARGEFVLVLNNDTRAAPNLLVALHSALTSDAAIGAAGPVSNHVKGEALLRIGDQARDDENRRRLAATLSECAPLLQDVDTLSGLCLLMRRETIERIGGFDERYGHGNYEDDDLSLRLRLAGHRLVIARRAFLHHEGHATFRALGLDIKTEIERRLQQFAAKWRRHPAGRAVLAAMHHDAAVAADEARAAQALAPQWPDAWLHLARAAAARNDAAQTHRLLAAFLHRCPEHVEARLLLGTTMLRGGDQRGAALLADTAARHWISDDQQVACTEQLAQLAYSRGALDEAEEQFRQALERRPTRGDLHNWVGLCLLARQRYRDALPCFTAAAEHGHALAHTNLGICLRALGETDRAQAEFERAVVLLPHDPVARANYELDAAARAAAPTGPGARAALTSSATIS